MQYQHTYLIIILALHLHFTTLLNRTSTVNCSTDVKIDTDPAILNIVQIHSPPHQPSPLSGSVLNPPPPTLSTSDTDLTITDLDLTIDNPLFHAVSTSIDMLFQGHQEPLSVSVATITQRTSKLEQYHLTGRNSSSKHSFQQPGLPSTTSPSTSRHWRAV